MDPDPRNPRLRAYLTKRSEKVGGSSIRGKMQISEGTGPAKAASVLISQGRGQVDPHRPPRTWKFRQGFAPRDGIGSESSHGRNDGLLCWLLKEGKISLNREKWKELRVD